MGHVIGIDTTYTGNPVSFNAAHGGTMKSVSVPLTYSQDLHGYANPWPAGGGKNLVDPNTTIYKRYLRDAGGGSYYWAYSDDSASIAIKVDHETSYTLSRYLTTGGIYRVSTIRVSSLPSLSDTTDIPTYQNVRETTASGFGSTRTITTDASATYVVIQFNGTTIRDFVVHGQFERGSTATEYAPYSNICPISGRTGLSVYVGPTQDVADATTYSVDWTTQAGTVYHGTVDPVAGQLTVDRASVDLGSLTWYYNPTTYPTWPFFYAVINEKKNGWNNGIMEAYRLTSGQYTRSEDFVFTCAPYYSAKNVIIRDSRFTAPSALKNAVTGQKYVYELATPLTYQLTPKQIAALIGQNYIWSSNNEAITAVLTAPATGFAGWLIKCVTNGTPVEIPLKYMRAETYTVTPDQRMEWSAERDVTGVLHRETVQNLPPKIEFNTPLMTNSDINALNNIIKAAFTNYLQRNITIQFYDPERDQYWEWDCYMPDVKYHIRNADTVNNIINYEELRYAFIGY